MRIFNAAFIIDTIWKELKRRSHGGWTQTAAQPPGLSVSHGGRTQTAAQPPGLSGSHGGRTQTAAQPAVLSGEQPRPLGVCDVTHKLECRRHRNSQAQRLHTHRCHPREAWGV